MWQKIDKNYYFSAYGFIADIDIESEIIQSIGSIRFTIFALMKIAKLQHYKVKLWYRKYIAPDTNTKDISDSPVEEIIEQRSEETESSDRGENVDRAHWRHYH